MEQCEVVMDIVKLRDTEKFLMLEKYRGHGHERYSRTPFETPGGKIEDETVKEAALRELEEETGLEGEIVDTGEKRTRKEKEVELVFRPVLLKVDSRDIELSDEHVGYSWITEQGVRHVATETEIRAFEKLAF